MLLRLLLGIVKGLIVGALAGYGLVAAGFAVPPALMAYGGAAAMGALIALVAGKPIWAKDARIEVGTKMVAGAIIAPLLLIAVRRWLPMAVPDAVTLIPGLEALKGTSLALGTFAMTSLAMVTAVVAGFFEADHQPGKDDGDTSRPAPRQKQRIEATDEAAAAAEAAAAEALAEVEAASRKRR